MRTRSMMALSWFIRGKNRFVGLDRYADPESYFGPGGLAEAASLCREANRDLLAFVRPPERVEPQGLERVHERRLGGGVLREAWVLDSPRPSGRACNDRVHFRVYRPPGAADRGPVLLFHHPVYQRRWPLWEWFLAPLFRRIPVAVMVGPNHFERAGDGRFAGEWTINPNPARLFEALRQWCWDHQATVRALETSCGLQVAAEIGFSLGAFQTLLLAAAGRVDVPIVSMAATNRYAWGLTHGVMGKGLLHAMRQGGIDEGQLFALTESVELERHVGGLDGHPVFFICGSRDPVDPEPSQQRLREALRPTRTLRLLSGHGSILFHRGRIMRETWRFLQEIGAVPG